MRGRRWPSLTPLPGADTIRSVGNEASTYDHRWLSVSVTCLALAGTHMTVLAPFRSSRIQLPASLPSSRFCSPSLSDAGDRLAAALGRLGFLARELLDEVPRVLTTLRP